MVEDLEHRLKEMQAKEVFSPEELLAGEKLFQGACVFERSSPSLETLPPATLPEMAFIGRSNVGKSSLLNALVGHHGLARTSNTPGRTQTLNFFNLAQALYLVDLPGYGYAQAPKKMVAKWQQVLKAYLQGRTVLKRAFLLVDSRHGIKENDEEIMTLLDGCAVSYQIVLTKLDKISVAQGAKALEEAQAILPKHVAAYPRVHACSSVTKVGLKELKAEIYRLIQL